jgi:hypothetical protein
MSVRNNKVLVGEMKYNILKSTEMEIISWKIYMIMYY